MELDVDDEVVEAKLHVVKEHQRRRVVRRKTFRCRACDARTTPRSLPAPYTRSKITCEWLAWLVHQQFGLLAPLDRIRRDLAERNIPIAMGTLVSFIERAADLLAPIDGFRYAADIEFQNVAKLPGRARALGAARGMGRAHAHPGVADRGERSLSLATFRRGGSSSMISPVR